MLSDPVPSPDSPSAPQVADAKSDLLFAEYKKFEWLALHPDYRVLLSAAAPIALPIQESTEIPDYVCEGKRFGQIEFHGIIKEGETEYEIRQRWHTPSNAPYLEEGPVFVVERKVGDEWYRLVDLSSKADRDLFDQVKSRAGKDTLRIEDRPVLASHHLWVSNSYVLDDSPLRENPRISKSGGSEERSLEERFREMVKVKSHTPFLPDKGAFAELVEQGLRAPWSEDGKEKVDLANERLLLIKKAKISWANLRRVVGNTKDITITELDEVVRKEVVPKLSSPEGLQELLGNGRIKNYLHLLAASDSKKFVEVALSFLQSVRQSDPLKTATNLLKEVAPDQLVGLAYRMLRDTKTRYPGEALLRAAKTLKEMEGGTKNDHKAQVAVYEYFRSTRDLTARDEIAKWNGWGSTDVNGPTRRTWLLGAVGVLVGGGIAAWKLGSFSQEVRNRALSPEEEVKIAARFYRAQTQRYVKALWESIEEMDAESKGTGGPSKRDLDLWTKRIHDMTSELKELKEPEATRLLDIDKVSSKEALFAELSPQKLTELEGLNGVSFHNYAVLMRAVGISCEPPALFVPGLFSTALSISEVLETRSPDFSLLSEKERETLKGELGTLVSILEEADLKSSQLCISVTPPVPPATAEERKFQTGHIRAALDEYQKAFDSLSASVLSGDLATGYRPLQRSVPLEGPVERRTLSFDDGKVLGAVCPVEARLAESLGLGTVRISCSYDWSPRDGNSIPEQEPVKMRGLFRMAIWFEKTLPEGEPASSKAPSVCLFSKILHGHSHLGVPETISTDRALCEREIRGILPWIEEIISKPFRDEPPTPENAVIVARAKSDILLATRNVIHSLVTSLTENGRMNQLPSPDRWATLIRDAAASQDQAVDPTVREEKAKLLKLIGDQLKQQSDRYRDGGTDFALEWAKPETKLQEQFLDPSSKISRRLSGDERSLGDLFGFGSDSKLLSSWLKTHAFGMILDKRDAAREVEGGQPVPPASSSINQIAELGDLAFRTRRLAAILLFNRVLGGAEIRSRLGQAFHLSPVLLDEEGYQKIYGSTRDHEKFLQHLRDRLAAVQRDPLRLPFLFAEFQKEIEDTRKAVEDIGSIGIEDRSSLFVGLIKRLQTIRDRIK